MFFIYFQKKIMSFEGLELYNELLESVNSIIQNYQRRRWTVGEQRIV
jgi:hypothetical protein